MAAVSNRTQAPRPAGGSGSLRVGRLTKPHGLKGGVKVEMYTDNPKLRFFPGAEFSLQVPAESEWFGKTVTLRELRWFNEQPVAFFSEVPGRNEAESIVRAILWIDEVAVNAGTEENAWYHHELVGLDVHRDGVSIGSVAEVQHFPAQDLLVVKTANGNVLLPFVEALVPNVDMDARVVTITPPAGLFEELPDANSELEAANAASNPAGAHED